MINGFKGKIDTHKAVVLILNNKSNHLINAFAITQSYSLCSLIFQTANIMQSETSTYSIIWLNFPLYPLDVT